MFLCQKTRIFERYFYFLLSNGGLNAYYSSSRFLPHKRSLAGIVRDAVDRHLAAVGNDERKRRTNGVPYVMEQIKKVASGKLTTSQKNCP